MFLVFDQKKTKNVFFFLFRLRFSLKNNRRKNVLLVGIFENALKKNYQPSKTLVLLFFAVINFFQCIFKNIDQNNIFVSIVFKAKAVKQKKNMKTNFCLRFLFQNHKHAFLRGQHIFSFCFSFKNNKCTNVVLVNIFKDALKKGNNHQKLPKLRFDG